MTEVKQKNPYTLRLTDSERELYDNFAKANGYNTLSKLIKDALDIVIQNPSLLNPLAKEEYNLSEVRKIVINEFESQQEKSQESNKEFEKRFTLLEQKIDLILKHLSFSPSEVEKKLKNPLKEVIFNDK